MYILEIFFKRRKFTTIFNAAWKLIGKNISPVKQGDATDSRLELFYFTSIFYCTVFHAAVSAGMSTSAAHYLARNQTEKSKVDSAIVLAAHEVFAVPDDEKLQRFAGHLNASVKPIIAVVAKEGLVADEAKFSSALEELHQHFRQCDFSVDDLFLSER